MGTAISAARPEEGGLASGLVSTSYPVSSAIGLAVMTAVAGALGADRLSDVAGLTNGFSAAFIGAGIIAAVGALAAAGTLRAPAQPAPSDAPQEELVTY